MSVRFTRPDSASDLLSHDKVFRDPVEFFKKFTSSAPIAGASLPSIGGVQEYTEANSRVANTIICAGTVAAISADNLVGVLLHDAIAGSAYATYCWQGGIVTLNAAVEAYADGLDCYITLATMVCTLVDGGSGVTQYIGKCRSAIKTNPEGYPAGSYVDVFLDQGQDV
jgi:hypothetical protein